MAEELQTLARGLDALAFLNAHGPANLATVARHLDLPRANVGRILTTLVATGYCARIPNAALYAVTAQVRRLSEGLRESDLLTVVALPIVEALGQALGWPIALATPHGAEMLVRLSTDMTTPLALLKTRPGFTTPLLLATTGLLTLAFLPDEIRAARLPWLIANSAINPALSAATIGDALRSARADGYLLLDQGFPEASLGVPILVDGRPLGGLVMRYIARGRSRRVALERDLPRLQEAAIAIRDAFLRARD